MTSANSEGGVSYCSETTRAEQVLERIRSNTQKAKAIRRAALAKAGVRTASELQGVWNERRKTARQSFEFSTAGHLQSGQTGQREITVELVGEMTDDTLIGIVPILAANPCAERLTVLVNSPGGQSNIGLTLNAYLSAHGARRKVGIITNACSAALLAILACSTRIAAPHALFLAHGVTLRGATPDQARPEDRPWLREYVSAYRDFTLALAGEAGVNCMRLAKLHDAGKCFNAAMAKDIRLIDGISEAADRIHRATVDGASQPDVTRAPFRQFLRRGQLIGISQTLFRSLIPG